MTDTDLKIEEAFELDAIAFEAVEVEEIALREERAGWCLCSYND